MPDELALLFPDLNLNDPSTPSFGDGHDDPSHSGITGQDIEKAILARGGRVLSPANSGQDPNLPVQFVSGHGGAMPNGGVEGSEGGVASDTPGPAQAPPAPVPTDPEAPSDPTPPAPPVTPPEPSEPVPQSEPNEEDEPLTPEQIAAFREFQHRLTTDPGLRERIVSYYSGAEGNEEIGSPRPPAAEPGASTGQALTPPVPSAPETPIPTPIPGLDPSLLDLSDPTTAALYNHLIQQQEVQQQLIQRLTAHDDFLTRQQTQTAASLVNRAVQSYQSQHSLTDEQMARVRNVASGLNVLDSLQQGYNPSTGQYELPDLMTSIERALDLAYWQDPELRARELAATTAATRADSQRKQKLAALSGGSGSVPRVQAPPANEQERRTAMVRDVAAMMNGSYVSGDE